MLKKKTVLFVDGHAMLYRAFHGFPDLTNPQGQLVNAVYGFGRLLLTSINDFQPEFVAVMFDHRAPTFRHEQFKEYKAHREEMPDGLKPQVEMVKELVDVLNIPRYELAGYEADDLIGTATWQLEKDISPFLDRAIVMTGDSDLLQLVTDFTKVFIPKRGKFGKDKLYNPDDVQEKYGVQPSEIPQLKALTGDSSDNIPGVPGIGPKTARTIFESIDTIAELYQILDSPDVFETHQLKKTLSVKNMQKLLVNRESAQMSLELATIQRDVPFEFDLQACRLRSYDKDAAVAYMEKNAFKSLIKVLPEDEFEAGIQSALF